MLNQIKAPGDIKALDGASLHALAGEIRSELIETTLENGGHLASNLGCVELTIALHTVFHAPEDKLIFDVGHQAYTHKLLTGRHERFHTLRQKNGLSGFPRRDESEYDAYGTGHASTAISAALGMARARDLAGEKHSVVAVVGDGALTGGLCYEALNDAGQSGVRLIVILNDNEMSISKNVGAVARHLTQMRQSRIYQNIKQRVRRALDRVPGLGAPIMRGLRWIRDAIKSLFISDRFFDALGFDYLGPIDGHDVKQLISVLSRAREAEKPVLLHVVTRKGKGYPPAEEAPEKYHGVSPRGFAEERDTVASGAVAAECLIDLAKADARVCAVTAAMEQGTGLCAFAKAFPSRFFDVGIAEEHAVVMASGMALGGMRPYVAIYSTFLQRAYDQLMTDVCQNNAPVTFLVDRGGLCGADGTTHQGTFDLSYLRSLPGMTVASPENEAELRRMIALSADLRAPMAIRYGKRLSIANACADFALGQWEILSEGNSAVILAVGRMVAIARAAARAVGDCGVVNARFIKPMDEEILFRAAKANLLIVTLEDNCVFGGFGAGVAEWMSARGFAANVLMLGVPDRYIAHATIDEQTAECGIDAVSVAQRIRARLGKAENA